MSQQLIAIEFEAFFALTFKLPFDFEIFLKLIMSYLVATLARVRSLFSAYLCAAENT